MGLLAGAPGEAQVTTGTIVGTVKDEQGAAVPGATVTITEVNKGTVGTYTTDADGSFDGALPDPRHLRAWRWSSPASASTPTAASCCR